MNNSAALNTYLNSLTSEINNSVERLKAKNAHSSKTTAFSAEAESGLAPLSQSLRPQAYRLLGSELSYQLTAAVGQSEPMDSSYAAGSYDSASRVNRAPTVLVDLMFANNREFDFKV